MEITPRDRKMLIVLGVVAGLAAVYFLATSLLGGEEEPPPAAEPPPATEVPSPVPTETPTETPPPVLVVGGRDPFSIPPALLTTSPSPGDGTTSPSPGGTPTPPPTAPGGGTSTTMGGRTIVLLSIFTRDGEQLAQVEVDGTVFTVSEGESFAGNFQLVSISGSCARFLFGDEGFTLCEAERK